MIHDPRFHAFLAGLMLVALFLLAQG